MAAKCRLFRENVSEKARTYSSASQSFLILVARPSTGSASARAQVHLHSVGPRLLSLVLAYRCLICRQAPSCIEKYGREWACGTLPLLNSPCAILPKSLAFGYSMSFCQTENPQIRLHWKGELFHSINHSPRSAVYFLLVRIQSWSQFPPVLQNLSTWMAQQ